MFPSDRGREAQHLSVKSVPQTVDHKEELMLRKDVWNSYDFHLFFPSLFVKDNLWYILSL